MEAPLTLEPDDDGVITLYLDGAPAAWKTSSALIPDPDLTATEARWVTAKADIAFGMFAAVDPSLITDAELDWWARLLLIPLCALAASDDDRAIADEYLVPAVQVSRARRERRLRLDGDAVARLSRRRRPR